MVVDLYKAMLKKDRKYFSVVDGIVGGEGQGTFCPTSKFSNTIIAGDDLFAVDRKPSIMSTIVRKIPAFLQGF